MWAEVLIAKGVGLVVWRGWSWLTSRPRTRRRDAKELLLKAASFERTVLALDEETKAHYWEHTAAEAARLAGDFARFERKYGRPRLPLTDFNIFPRKISGKLQLIADLSWQIADSCRDSLGEPGGLVGSDEALSQQRSYARYVHDGAVELCKMTEHWSIKRTITEAWRAYRENVVKR